MPPMRTGLTTADAPDDFTRARRRQAVSRLARFLTRERGDIDVILPFDEVVAALGRTGERDLGLKAIPLYSILGTVDRKTDFDREFRPTHWRPEVPRSARACASALGAHRRGDAPRPPAAADVGLPRRRRAPRQAPPPS